MPSNTNRDIMSLIQKIVSSNILDTNYDYAPVAPQQNKPSFAEYLLTHQIAGPKVAPGPKQLSQGAQAEEPSFLNTLFDAASGPLYAARAIVEGQVENVKDFVQDPGLDTAADFFTESAKSIAGGAAQSFAAGSRIPGTIGSIMPDSMIEPIQKFADDQAPKRLGHDPY